MILLFYVFGTKMVFYLGVELFTLNSAWSSELVMISGIDCGICDDRDENISLRCVPILFGFEGWPHMRLTQA